jgi:hypothetical protein
MPTSIRLLCSGVQTHRRIPGGREVRWECVGTVLDGRCQSRSQRRQATFGQTRKLEVSARDSLAHPAQSARRKRNPALRTRLRRATARAQRHDPQGLVLGGLFFAGPDPAWLRGACAVRVLRTGAHAQSPFGGVPSLTNA